MKRALDKQRRKARSPRPKIQSKKITFSKQVLQVVGDFERSFLKAQELLEVRYKEIIEDTDRLVVDLNHARAKMESATINAWSKSAQLSWPTRAVPG
jgi:hypothetical protein